MAPSGVRARIFGVEETQPTYEEVHEQTMSAYVSCNTDSAWTVTPQ